MEALVFASSVIRMQEVEQLVPEAARLEALYQSQGQGVKDVARVAAMLVGIVLYAGLLAMVST